MDPYIYFVSQMSASLLKRKYRRGVPFLVYSHIKICWKGLLRVVVYDIMNIFAAK